MKSKILFSVLFAAFLGIANISMAQDGHYARNHSRRSEVNHRLARQHNRINRKVAHGRMNNRQADRLHRRDHQIRREERRMAYRHDGHLTARDHQRLNRQENHLSRRIRRA